MKFLFQTYNFSYIDSSLQDMFSNFLGIQFSISIEFIVVFVFEAV